MLSNIYDNLLRKLILDPLSGIRLGLFVYWHTRSKTPVIVSSVLFMTGGLVAWMISSQINKTRITEDITCLALNIYHEARGEPESGQYAVANVTLNRVKSKHYPNEICDVVFQKNWDKKRKRYVSAFSWTELDSRSNKNTKEWKQALKIAKAVHGGARKTGAKDALFYHANYIKPVWAKNKTPAARIGKHIFYN